MPIQNYQHLYEQVGRQYGISPDQVKDIVISQYGGSISEFIKALNDGSFDKLARSLQTDTNQAINNWQNNTGFDRLTSSLDSVVPGAIVKVGAGGNTAVANLSDKTGEFESLGFKEGVQTTAESGAEAVNQKDIFSKNDSFNKTDTFDKTDTSSVDKTISEASGFSKLDNSLLESSKTNTIDQTQQNVVDTLSRRSVDDTLGLGALIAQQGANVAANDAIRAGYLADLVQQGTGRFQTDVGNAVAKALSGPGMLGVGDAAKGRAVGSAVANVAQQEQATRLAAANQLGQLGGLGSLANATSGYLGTTDIGSNVGKVNTTGYSTDIGRQTGANVSSGTTLSSGTENMTGSNQSIGTNVGFGTNTSSGTNVSDKTALFNKTGSATAAENELNRGTSGMKSAKLAFGEQPENVSDTSFFFCKFYHNLGLFTDKEFANDIEFGKNLHTNINVAYRMIAENIVERIGNNKFKRLFYYFITRFWVRIAQNQENLKHPFLNHLDFVAKFVSKLGKSACWVVFHLYAFPVAIFESSRGLTNKEIHNLFWR